MISFFQAVTATCFLLVARAGLWALKELLRLLFTAALLLTNSTLQWQQACENRRGATRGQADLSANTGMNSVFLLCTCEECWSHRSGMQLNAKEVRSC